MTERRFGGEPLFISLAGRFWLDPLRETSAKPLSPTLEMAWLADPAVLFTCDPQTVGNRVRVTGTRSFVTHRGSARLHRTVMGEPAPPHRVGGVPGGRRHSLRLTFENAFVFESDVSRSVDGTASLDFGYNDAIIGLPEGIAPTRGVTLHR